MPEDGDGKVIITMTDIYNRLGEIEKKVDKALGLEARVRRLENGALWFVGIWIAASVGAIFYVFK